MDLATKIVGLAMFAFAVIGIIYRQGKSDARILGRMELMSADIDAKVEALRVGQAALKDGQAENRMRAEEILGEVKAHTGNAAIHVNTQLETLKEKVDEDRYKDLARKLDELLRTK